MSLSLPLDAATTKAHTNKMPRTIPRTLPAALVVNTKSRRGVQFLPLAEQTLKQQGFNLKMVLPVHDPARLTATVRQALDGGAKLIILGSGDGTVSEVVDTLAHNQAVLGYIPLGTTNNFARSLGLPLNVPQALQALYDGRVTKIDLAHVNNDYFANVCSIGLSAQIAATVSHQQKRWLGRAAYGLAGLRALVGQKAFHAVLKDGLGQERHITTRQLIVANGRSHAGRPLTDYAHIADGKLTVFITRGSSRWRLIKTLLAASYHHEHPLAEVMHFETDWLQITTDSPQPIEIDGEIKTATPATIAIESRALRVVVPNGEGMFKDSS